MVMSSWNGSSLQRSRVGMNPDHALSQSHNPSIDREPRGAFQTSPHRLFLDAMGKKKPPRSEKAGRLLLLV